MAKKENEKKPGRKPGAKSRSIQEKLEAITKNTSASAEDTLPSPLKTLAKEYSEAYERFIKGKYATFTLRFNLHEPEDVALLEHLRRQKNKTKFILGLLRKDMNGTDFTVDADRKPRIDFSRIKFSKYYQENIERIANMSEADELEGYNVKKNEPE